MYPEIILGGVTYIIDQITPFIGLILLIILLYKITKSQGLLFRDIVGKLPVIIIVSLLCGTYVNFMFQSGKIIPSSRLQFSSLFSFSVNSIDFVGLLIGASATTFFAIRQMSSKLKSQWLYILMLTYLGVLLVLGVFYIFGDSVVGKLNEGFFSVGSFSTHSRITQLGGSVYPIGLLISAWSALCLIIGRYLRRHYPSRAGYRLTTIFLLGYVVILHYQHYPRHLICQSVIVPVGP